MRRAQTQLEHLSGPEDGKIVGFSKEIVTIGRDSGQDIVLGNDAAVSRQHARVIREGERLFVEDAGSSHGLFLNGERVEGKRELPPGSLLRMGKSWLRVPD